MVDFSLSKDREKILPEFVVDHGVKVPVDADFRTVLRCFRVLIDQSINTGDRLILLKLWFFKGNRVSDPVSLFKAFVTGREDEETPDRVIDFEQDADAIYASFLQQYGIDLVDVPYLHWGKFLVLLSGLDAKTALGARITIRTTDTRKMEPAERAKFERMRRRISLKEAPVNSVESALIKAVDDALAAGGSATAEIKALNDYYKNQGGEDIGE